MVEQNGVVDDCLRLKWDNYLHETTIKVEKLSARFMRVELYLSDNRWVTIHDLDKKPVSLHNTANLEQEQLKMGANFKSICVYKEEIVYKVLPKRHDVINVYFLRSLKLLSWCYPIFQLTMHVTRK